MNDQVTSIYGKAEALGVGIGEACDRAGIARSTASRWRSGAEPRAHLLSRLDAAIVAIAHERGTLSPTNGHKPPGELSDVVATELQQIMASIARIAAALGISLP